MPACLFCTKEHEKLTAEHVFPAALGGVLTVNSGTCTECNNGLSKSEQALAEELAPIRLLLQIPDRYGHVPQIAATAKTEEREYEARIQGDGTVRVKPLVTEVKGQGGGREFVHQFLTDEQRERLRVKAQGKGQEFVETGPGEPVRAEIHFGGDLKVIGSEAGLRTVAKIAYVGLAHQCGVKVAMSGAFDEIRAYIRKGTGERLVRLFSLQRYMEAVQMGPHQHAIIVAGRHDQRRVDAIVRLFGGVCYFVRLSDHYEGADFFDTLVYDAFRGQIGKMLVAHEQAEILQIEDVANNPDTVWENLEMSGRQFCEFLDAEIAAKLSKEREKP